MFIVYIGTTIRKLIGSTSENMVKVALLSSFNLKSLFLEVENEFAKLEK